MTKIGGFAGGGRGFLLKKGCRMRDKQKNNRSKEKRRKGQGPEKESPPKKGNKAGLRSRVFLTEQEGEKKTVNPIR